MSEASNAPSGLDPAILVDIAEKSSRILAEAMKREAGAGSYSMGDEMGIHETSVTRWEWQYR